MKEQIGKLLKLLICLYVLHYLLRLIIQFPLSSYLEESYGYSLVATIYYQCKLLSFTHYFFVFLINIALAEWVYKKSKNGLWAVLVLLTGVFAVIFYYTLLLLPIVKRGGQESSDRTKSVDTLSKGDSYHGQHWTSNNAKVDTKIEKLVVLIFMLYFVVILGMLGSYFMLSIFFPGLNVEGAFTMQSKSICLGTHFLGLILNIGASIWLFLKSKRDNNSAFFWGILGFFMGLFTIVFYYLFSLDTLPGARPEEKGGNTFA